MARYRRSDQMEERLTDHLEVGDRAYTVDLIAKRATGVEGYRLTLSYIEVDGPGAEFVQIDPADTREEAEERAAELADAPDRLRETLEAHRR